jgi:hypothetical protein
MERGEAIRLLRVYVGMRRNAGTNRRDVLPLDRVN